MMSQKHFHTLHKRIAEELKSEHGELCVNHMSPEQFSLYTHFTHLKNKIYIYVSPGAEEADKLFEEQKEVSFADKRETLLLPGFDHSIHSTHLTSERVIFERFFTISKMLHHDKKNPLVIITSLEALSWWLPNRESIANNTIHLEISDIISPYELKENLFNIGYEAATTTEEPGTFSARGEILDIFPINESFAYRINYFDDMIEQVFRIDPDTNQSIKVDEIEKLSVAPSPRMFIKQSNLKFLLESIPNFGPSEKNKFLKRKEIISKVNDEIIFENYPLYLPLFFEQKVNFYHFFQELEPEFIFFNSNNIFDSWESHVEQAVLDFEFLASEPSNDNILPDISYFYDLELSTNLSTQKTIAINEVNITEDLTDSSHLLDFNTLTLNQLLKDHYVPSLGKEEFYKRFFSGLKSHFEKYGHIVFLYVHDSAKKQFEHFLEVFDFGNELNRRIDFLNFPLKESFYYEAEKVLFLSESSIFSSNLTKVKKQKKVDLDLFAEQLATLKIGDYIIHNDHGVGKYLGMESIDISGTPSDYLIIEYANNDKVYLPVYKMDLIQKHAGSASELKIDNLRTNKFRQVKSRARESAKKLAFDLLKLQAKRTSSPAFAFSPPDDIFDEFIHDFPYQETTDQMSAAEKVVKDMQKPIPMDHLVCGDVGFGKTEVAMRAAFKAICDQKQVAVLVPTTILALQHYNTFCKRFGKFPVKVDFISRLKTTKQCNEVFSKVENGEVDILIGTHKILSDKIKYKDLGLVIVDEEQRFGVNHKEKLKMLKASVDFLTLTATPLPRTLQLGFLGLKDISIIKTPPPRRQSIKTYIIKEDAHTLKSAITKEINRGGQVFIVHNRVQDIEYYSSQIRDLVPNAKISIAHGQMNEKDLEKRIDEFYRGKTQILIATTIIESGIDIPNANTMIVNRADRYGLSQLHQLRGRIGRSDKKAYAYFVIPNDRSLTPVAERRLKTLQTYAEMGSGFNIASSDLEIRGSGDILGAHQSGHIESVGLELYTELLKDAIAELKGEERVYNKNIEVKTPFPSYIPNNYIESSSERLKQYKRLSNLSTYEDLEGVKNEYIDVYGPMPKELESLFMTLEIRVILSSCGIKSLSTVGSSINIQFDQDILQKNEGLSTAVINCFLSRPKLYKFSPDYKVLFNTDEPVTMDYLINFSKKIQREILSEVNG